MPSGERERQLLPRGTENKGQGPFSPFVFILWTAAAKLYLWQPFTTDVLSAFSRRHVSKADAKRTLLPKAYVCIDVKELETPKKPQGLTTRTQLVLLSGREGREGALREREPSLYPQLFCFYLCHLLEKGMAFG